MQRNNTIFTGLILGTTLMFASSAFAQVKLNYSVFFPAPHKNAVLAADWAKDNRLSRRDSDAGGQML
jgi:hypothetical protein